MTTAESGDLPGAGPSSDAAAWFEGLEAGELRVQSCLECGRSRFPRALLCSVCGSERSEWRGVPAEGTLLSYTVVSRAPSPEFEPHVPYRLALVELQPGCTLMVQIAGAAGAAGELDQQVRIEPIRVDSGWRLHGTLIDSPAPRS